MSSSGKSCFVPFSIERYSVEEHEKKHKQSGLNKNRKRMGGMEKKTNKRHPLPNPREQRLHEEYKTSVISF